MQVGVALPLPVESTYSYVVPDAWEDLVEVGSLVLVPVRDRRLSGVVTVLEDEALDTPYTIKAILDVLDAEPVIDGAMLGLTRWMSQYYVCGWGEAIRAALPRGIERREFSRIHLNMNAAAQFDSLPPALLKHLAAHGGTATWRGLRMAGLRTSRRTLQKAQRRGIIRIESTLENPRVRTQYARHVQFVPPFDSAAALKDLKLQLRGVKQRAVLDVLVMCLESGESEPSLKDVLARADASASSFNTLVHRGIIAVTKKEHIRLPRWLTPLAAASTTPPDYHPAQQAALTILDAALDARTYATFLLHGVTGSGKTEVYMAALQTVLDRDQTGIILVPEISLTPQTVERFRGRFGDQVAIMHSRMSRGERYDIWRQVRAGKFTIVVGTRSAILAPLDNIGLIVVDEEHDTSYKQQDPAPRYHARDVAVVRAKLAGAVCLLGSATPSLESMANAQSGKYRLLTLPERVPIPGYAAAPMPRVWVVDMGREHAQGRRTSNLSARLTDGIRTRLANREQIILLQNRRGFAPIFQCQECGFVPECRDCTVSLTYHKAYGELRCHYCGTARLPIQSCPECASEEFKMLGAGTQRIEEELVKHFPSARILRMDTDSTRQAHAHFDILAAFGRGEADLLIGTQMVAKGLDFSRVSLVGVVNSDIGLRLPDFRSEERIFQLLMQVAGRAGRAELRGEVILQTRQPDHQVFEHLIAHDYDKFAAHLLEQRKALSYPPYGRLVGIVFKGPSENSTVELAERWLALLKKTLPESVHILGPEAAYVVRVRNQYRYHMLLKAPAGFLRLQGLLRHVARQAGRPAEDYHVSIDVDSFGLL